MSSIAIRQIHLELSSRCNSACQLCPRYILEAGYYTKSPLLVERDLSLDIIHNIVNHPALATNRKWLLCGNLGEPMMHPDIVSIVQCILAKDHRQWISMHSNAGMGTVDMWHDLGKMLQGPRGQIIFSLDGLGDTNHIYRRNVVWDVVMRNAQAFIAAGGHAVWKFIDFAHNHHQIDAARQLATQLGFARFAVDTNSSAPLEPVADLEYRHRQPAKLAQLPADFVAADKNAEWRKHTVLDCEHTKFQMIYIDAQARVWPCCHLVTVLAHGDPARRRVGEHYLIDPYGTDWNDLHTNDIGQILQSPYWTDLYASLPGNTGMYKCSHSCGTNPVRTREREMETLNDRLRKHQQALY
jgi:MoaA/NifB/PqqE/SkfB family radical SAM enzyme